LISKFETRTLFRRVLRFPTGNDVIRVFVAAWKFNEADKPQILEEAVQAGPNLSEVARGIAARVLFRWK